MDTRQLTAFYLKDLNPNNGTFRIVKRGEWLAAPPTEQLRDLELPATIVIIAHTVTPMCSSLVSD